MRKRISLSWEEHFWKWACTPFASVLSHVTRATWLLTGPGAEREMGKWD